MIVAVVSGVGLWALIERPMLDGLRRRLA